MGIYSGQMAHGQYRSFSQNSVKWEADNLRLYCLVTADFDGDGVDDLWTVTNVGKTDVITFQGNATTTTDVSGLQLCGVPGDVDGDGDVDMIGWIGGSAYIIENTGNLTFNTILIDNDGDFPDTKLVDFDGDGDLDIVTIFRVWREWTYDVVFWENDGNGLKGQAVRRVLDDATFADLKSLAVEDFSGDGLPDVMVSDDGSGKVYLSLNQGNGTLGAWSELPSADMSGPEGIVAADFDGDGDIDAAVADWIKDGIHVFLNDGNANPTFAQTAYLFGNRTNGTFINNVYKLLFVDISGDGVKDLVANSTSTPVMGSGGGWMLNNGDGTFGSPTPFSDRVTSNYAMAAGDFDGDGDIDIARGRNFGTATDQLVVNYNEPLGTLSLSDTEWTFRHGVTNTAGTQADLDFRFISTTGAYYGRTPEDLVITYPDQSFGVQLSHYNTGYYHADNFRSYISGDRNVTLTSGGDQFEIPFRFEPGSGDRTKTLISADQANIAADGQTTATITVQLRDQYSNNLEAGGNAIELATTLGALGAVEDNNDGTYTATLTSGLVPGDATITGTLDGVAITDNAIVSFQVIAADATTSTITADPVAVTADGQSTSTVTVQAKDANSNNLQDGGDAVVLATTLGALGAIADNNDGTYTATLTAGVVAGTATITGTINGAAITDDADVTLNVGAAGSSVSLVQTSTTPDGDSVYTITIAVTDSDGNNVGTGGDDVSIASTVGVVSEVIDNQDGTYTATLTTSPQEGMAVITITVNGADNSTSTEVTLGPGDANAGRTTISANPLSIVADGQSTSTITIQAKDADGHNLADGGDAVVLATTLGSLGSVVDNLDGTYTATLTAGLQAGTAQIVGFINSDLISSTAQISFTEPNSAPVAVIEASVTSGRAPLEVILDGHSSSDANGDLLTYEWDLGDGTSSQEILITHIFEEGIFDVLLVVSDGNLTDSASVIIEVDMANIAPEAVITASSYVGQAPFLVDFSASASSDANGDSLGFSWDMGDGATRIGESVSHTYGAPGLFTVVLTVTDGSLSDNAEAEISVASGVSVEDSKLPAEVVLKAIYPNPFNLTTMVTYGLPSASKVRITATDLLGRQVATLVAGDMKAAGYHTVQLNADGLASGTYLILIEAGDFVASQQVVLLK